MISSIWLFIAYCLPVMTCQDGIPAGVNTAVYPADVVTSWLTMQLKITQTTPTNPLFPARRFAYTGIALYESVVPGLAGYHSIAPQLNGLSALPTLAPNATYYWPACANAAMAAMNRYFHPMTSAANKAAIDSLERAFTTLFAKDSPADELRRSADFGKKIAAAVFEWSQTDGNDNQMAYTPPVGTGLWVPTPPAFAPASLPNWGQCRPLMTGSDRGVDPGVPLVYSEDPASAYYAQAKEVYDLSQHLTAEQKTIALFWADNPDGKSYTSGHWFSILNQVLIKEKATLDRAAVAFAQLGIAGAEAGVCIFKGKYKHTTVRPITYIRTVMKQPNWNALIPTPPHPEYPSGHAVFSAAAAQTLTSLFGENYRFTDNSYNALGFKPRSYASFDEAAIEAGVSRVYGGIHYRVSCDESQQQGRIVARNVAKTLKFRG